MSVGMTKRFMREHPRLLIAIFVIGLALLLVTVITLMALQLIKPQWVFYASIFSMLTLPWLFIPIARAAFRGPNRRDHQNRICPDCQYPLDALASEGKCPECGRAYTFRELEAYWEHVEDLAGGEPRNPYRDQG